jgi:voltage-gated potassium channel
MIRSTIQPANESRKPGGRLETWESYTEFPLVALALAFLAAYSLQVLLPHADSGWRRSWASIITTTWLLFIADYVIRLALAERRWPFIRRNLLDLVSVLLPIFRPLRLLRLVRLLRVLDRRAARSLHGRVAAYVVGSVSLAVYVAAIAMLDAERGRPGSNIESFGDALWWSCATITTVGYGDRYPVTTTGRFIAVGLMIAGIALLGVVTATLATWFVQRVANAARDDSAAEIRMLRERVAQLESPGDA